MSDETEEALVGGRFRLGDLLGVGGSASVFAAEDTYDDDRLIAIKLLHERLATDPEEVETFLAPPRAVAELIDPNIAGVLAVCGDTSVPWIAMELALGLSAAEKVELDGPLGVGDALAIITGLLGALEAVHDAGLVHRDVSPGNIMIDGVSPLAPADVRLIDFGLTAASGLSAETVTVAGSVNYVSPEQAQGRTVDARGDLYQAGAVLYFLLTGRAPYPRDTTREVLEAHVSAQPPVPSAWSAGVPIAVDRIVTKAMAKTLRYRFATAAEMLAAVTIASEAHADQPKAGAEAATVVFSTTTASLLRSAPTERFSAVPGRVPGYTPEYLAQSYRGAHPVARKQRPVILALAVVLPLVLLTGIAAAVAGSGAPEPEVTPTAPAVEAAATPRVEAAPNAYVRVPSLGATLADAEVALARAGLTMTLVREQSASAADTVLRSEPVAAGSILRGGAVTVVVASGENSVPEVTSMTAAAAEAGLRGAGFGVTIVTLTDDSVATGTSLGTTPVAGTVLLLGTTVSLFVAEGPAVSEPTPTPTATAAPPTEPVTTVP